MLFIFTAVLYLSVLVVNFNEKNEQLCYKAAIGYIFSSNILAHRREGYHIQQCQRQKGAYICNIVL